MLNEQIAEGREEKVIVNDPAYVIVVVEWTVFIVGVKDIVIDTDTRLIQVGIITVLQTADTDITHITIPKVCMLLAWFIFISCLIRFVPRCYDAFVMMYF